MENRLTFDKLKGKIVTSTWKINFCTFDYSSKVIPLEKLQPIKDLGVVFDDELTVVAAMRMLSFMEKYSKVFDKEAILVPSSSWYL